MKFFDIDIFILTLSYYGNGYGVKYYKSEEMEMINGKLIACSIMIGCSSATYVEFNQYGIILSNILAGCPCVVGNLWAFRRLIY